MDSKDVGPSKLGRWIRARIEGKSGEATICVSTYRPFKNINRMSTVQNQQVCYFQQERQIEELDVYTLFITNLCKALGDMGDLGFQLVLGMNANDSIRDGSVSAAPANIGIKEVLISNHRGESVPVTLSKDKQLKPIDSNSIWTSPGLDVL